MGGGQMRNAFQTRTKPLQKSRSFVRPFVQEHVRLRVQDGLALSPLKPLCGNESTAFLDADPDMDFQLCPAFVRLCPPPGQPGHTPLGVSGFVQGGGLSTCEELSDASGLTGTPPLDRPTGRISHCLEKASAAASLSTRRCTHSLKEQLDD
jgi:hypothetical protein